MILITHQIAALTVSEQLLVHLYILYSLHKVGEAHPLALFMAFVEEYRSW